MEELPIEIDVAPLEAKNLAGPKTFHRQNAEKSSPRFFGDRENAVELVDREMWRFIPRGPRRKVQFIHVNLFVVVAPISGRRKDG
jgi:hypothetical protein